ncbi:hypothetical protein NP233_g9095 [Leucocoprinus birnbaumii]|uniref:Nephrocystin 3-like N-terminal domain-containing protein n=1 Tax=Leucocoprinus birnbaumii TaxID=56174 RepID=A0AAD5VPJ1_9AGAR|nr:hypothetical protein NP233_g9095 [Leucocoprinus birnbaumii]
MFDSAARNTAPRCHPGTREQYIEDFRSFGATPNVVGGTPLPILWMKGPAGVGKSAIAQSCVEKLDEQSIPFAAFFFSVNGRDSPGPFFPTIAYQLSLLFPDYYEILSTKMQHNRTIVVKSLRAQFRGLILDPLQQLVKMGKGINRRFPIFVDGLDECSDPQAQCEIIELVADAARTNDSPLCWVFFSRPEPHIEATFSQPHISNLVYSSTLPVSRDADTEIELYLRAGFKSILRRWNMPTDHQWPSERDLKRLVEASDGLFNYGATALRFIGSPFWLGPEEPLRQVLEGSNTLQHTPLCTHPFCGIGRRCIYELCRISLLGGFSLPCYSYITSAPSARLFVRRGLGLVYASNFLGLSEMEMRAICGQLSAVALLRGQDVDLELPTEIDITRSFLEHDPGRRHVPSLLEIVYTRLGGSVNVYHKSFLDFLAYPERSGSYCVRTTVALNNLFRHLIDRHLALDSSYVFNESTLLPTSDATSAASSLSYPSSNEFINSVIKVVVYQHITDYCTDMAFWSSADISLLRKYASCDFRKALYIRTALCQQTVPIPDYVQYGQSGYAKVTSGALLWRRHSIDFATYVDEFTKMIHRHLEAGILHQSDHIVQTPEPRDRLISGLYIRGQGSKSTFWYWEIDLDSQSYQEVQMFDLEYGMQIYKKESFEDWA